MDQAAEATAAPEPQREIERSEHMGKLCGCCCCRRRLASADGIGYMLLGSDIAAGDLDHCRDPETDTVDAWADDVSAAANGAYREITVSGSGLRIIGTAKGPATHRRFNFDKETGAGLELYRDTGRFITVSGNEIGHCAALAPIDGFIDAMLTQHSKRAAGTGGGLDFNAIGSQSAEEIDYDALIRNGAPEGQRSEMFAEMCVAPRYCGQIVDEIVAVLAQHINGIGAKYAGRLRAEVERSYEKWQAQRKPNEDGRQKASEPDEELTWKETDRKGQPRPSCTNARRALLALEIDCRYDVFHDRLMIESPIIGHFDNLDHSVQMLRTKIEKGYGFDPGSKNVFDAVLQLCLKNKFDPVLDYIEALRWDGKPRLDRWLISYAGAEDTELNREFGRIALIAAVRRARYPGTKFDTIIVLEGPMGTQKSKAIEVLAGTDNFSDQTILGARDQQVQELMAGIWLYEIAELSNIIRTEVEHIKAFASRTYDRARPAYGRARVDQPRRCVLFRDDQ